VCHPLAALLVASQSLRAERAIGTQTYLVEFMRKNYPQAANWPNDLAHLKQAARVESGFFMSEVRHNPSLITLW